MMKPRTNMKHLDTCLLCIDLSYQSYRASAKHRNLTSGRHFTGGLYGFFMSMAKAIREVDATSIVVCKDSRPYRRSEEYPEYKMLRKKNTDEELLQLHKKSMVLIEGVLRELGVAIWEEPGFESDDLIGHAVVKYRHRYGRIVAASNDSDLFQHLGAPNFSMFVKDVDDMWTLARLHEVHGLSPVEYMHMTALTGTHNDVEGIHNCGPVSAKKALRDVALMRRYREGHGALIDRNLGLIKLPHRDFPWDARIPKHSRIYDDRTLYRALGRYDIEVTGSMVNSFNKVLR